MKRFTNEFKARLMMLIRRKINNLNKQVIFLIALFVISTSLAAQNHTVTIKADGFDSSKGQAIIRVYGNEKGFPKKESHATRVIKCKIYDSQCVTKINLPQGEYAFAIIHDLNSNNTLDKNWVGMPVEPVGLSNFRKIGNPSFNKSKIQVDDDIVIQITMLSLFN